MAAPTMSRKSPRTANGRRTRRQVAAVLEEIDRLRADAGISLRTLASEARVSQGYLSQVLAGTREPSISVVVALVTALGADLSMRVYPNTGPVVRDGIQARIVEELLRIAAPTWRRSVEVAVSRPARGSIDLVFDDATIAIATEVQSRIDRLEQQIRWAQDKARSLPSSDMWRFDEGDLAISRLLVLRSSASTRRLVTRFGATLEAAYPASAAHAFAALTVGGTWPGAAILWADVGGDVVRIRDRPPRAVPIGR